MSAAVAPEPPKIGVKRLGATGLRVSELTFGCMTIGTSDKSAWGMPTANEEVSVQLMNEYTRRGGFFFDTADVYGFGESETVLGRWMGGKKRDDLVISTKVRANMGMTANAGGLSRKHIMEAVDGSLKRLGTDYIDIYHVGDLAFLFSSSFSCFLFFFFFFFFFCLLLIFLSHFLSSFSLPFFLSLPFFFFFFSCSTRSTPTTLRLPLRRPSPP